MPSRLCHILSEYALERGKLARACDAFFVSVAVDRPMGEQCVNRLVRRLKARTGFDFSAHSLRHTFATLMLEGGCDIYTLSRMMGHSKVTTTAGYLACSAKLLARSAERHPLNRPF